MRIRRAHSNDAPAIRALIDRFTVDGTLLPRTEAFIAHQCDHFLVADIDGRVVGCVHLEEYAPSLAELRSLAVDREVHGAGVGTALVQATLDLARKRGHTTVFAVSNDEQYFARFGFAVRHIPELDRERSEVSRYKGVFATDTVVV